MLCQLYVNYFQRYTGDDVSGNKAYTEELSQHRDGYVFEISVTLFGLTTVSFSMDSSIRSVSTLLTLSHLEVLPHCCSGEKWMSRTA